MSVHLQPAASAASQPLKNVLAHHIFYFYSNLEAFFVLRGHQSQSVISVNSLWYEGDCIVTARLSAKVNIRGCSNKDTALLQLMFYCFI